MYLVCFGEMSFHSLWATLWLTYWLTGHWNDFVSYISFIYDRVHQLLRIGQHPRKKIRSLIIFKYQCMSEIIITIIRGGIIMKFYFWVILVCVFIFWIYNNQITWNINAFVCSHILHLKIMIRPTPFVVMVPLPFYHKAVSVNCSRKSV